MITLTEAHWREHLRVAEESLPQLQAQAEAVATVLIKILDAGGKVLAFGNGGSATQASHFAGELVGRFAKTRRPFPAIALSNDSSTVTCIANDFGYESLFARQVEALAQPGDIVFGFTTSGRSENVIRALAMGRERRATTVALTGKAGLSNGTADFILAAPSASTACIQEIHLMLLHVWCLHVDKVFAN
jgi:D-sedoheptulose 7-phosphate isomerase